MSNPWNCFTPSDLESAIKVLEAIHNNPDLKRTAAVNEDMKRLMIAIQKHSDPWKERRREKRKRESEEVEATGIRKLRRKGTFAHGSASNLVGINDAPAIVDPLVDYGSISPSPVADMSGRVCLVTGGRIKIGFQIALQLLRANAATVIGRLVIYGVDFRGIGMVKQFCLDVKRKFDRLDVLINNAAQTVRRPPAFMSIFWLESQPGKYWMVWKFWLRMMRPWL
ncbi:hypothetical protein BCR33DRAFT_787797 [Rhizoclosmatium globosum]|uniref:NAD(P)-binding protein n=1 Tax=Rhizoclosmatium globosum TaxID=329046 RepID=A0A1Y2BYF0_9FUNG|nr:hypothetical protein BCR33DRAFT_787797 [Rhizoclosmatium globosum]|eukprot:ORY39809.1 hypothetical protein BCR33DRAFT_787797 [Rhizoclosmatium globosum]